MPGKVLSNGHNCDLPTLTGLSRDAVYKCDCGRYWRAVTAFWLSMQGPEVKAAANADPQEPIPSISYEPCQTAKDWGECVLANGHETWESGMVGATPNTSQRAVSTAILNAVSIAADRNGRSWGIAAGGA